jgi:hypothetical protein
MEGSSQPVSPVWRGLSWVALLGFFGAAIWCYFHTPSTGKGGILLAVAASLMPLFWEKISPLERVFWIAMLFTLLRVEYRAINKDQKDLADKFQGIADQLKDSTQKAKDILANISGEGSFPCIVPQSHAASDTSIPLTIWNKGEKNNLTGVRVTVLSQSEFLNGGPFLKLPVDIGTLPPDWGEPLLPVSPKLGADGQAMYQIDIWDQTGFYTEVIRFRKGKYKLPWAYEYWLTKQIVSFKSHSSSSVPIADCSSSWSDDLGDGKPIPKSP